MVLVYLFLWHLLHNITLWITSFFTNGLLCLTLLVAGVNDSSKHLTNQQSSLSLCSLLTQTETIQRLRKPLKVFWVSWLIQIWHHEFSILYFLTIFKIFGTWNFVFYMQIIIFKIRRYCTICLMNLYMSSTFWNKWKHFTFMIQDIFKTYCVCGQFELMCFIAVWNWAPLRLKLICYFSPLPVSFAPFISLPSPISFFKVNHYLYLGILANSSVPCKDV